MAQGPSSANKWPDNRIGHDHQNARRYDAWTTALSRPVRGQRVHYDGANQLVAVEARQAEHSELDQVSLTTIYIYDALGRRLKKQTQDAQGARSSYFGWDGDQLVHTETQKPQREGAAPESKQISHTVYGPDSFTPMVRLSSTGIAPMAKGFAAMLDLGSSGDEEDEES